MNRRGSLGSCGGALAASLAGCAAPRAAAESVFVGSRDGSVYAIT